MEEESDADLEKEKELFEVFDKIREHSTESAGEKLSLDLDDFENMKSSIKSEIAHRIEHLRNEHQKWKTYNENREQFEQWLKLTEKDLKAFSTTSINLDTPTTFQVSNLNCIECSSIGVMINLTSHSCQNFLSIT